MSADSAFVIVGTLVVVVIAERVIRELEFRYRAAIERIDGYIHGYRDGEKQSMAAVNVWDDDHRREVPEAFAREFPR